MSHRYLEILDFTQFFDHFVFTPNAENVLEKELKREIPVSVWNRTGSGGYVKKWLIYKEIRTFDCKKLKVLFLYVFLR